MSGLVEASSRDSLDLAPCRTSVFVCVEVRLTHASLILTHILTEPCEFLQRRSLLRGTGDGVPADEALDALPTSISSVLVASPVSSSNFTLIKRDKVGIGRHFQIASERQVENVGTGARNHCEVPH